MELYPTRTAIELPFKSKALHVLRILGWCYLLFTGAGILMATAELIIKNHFHISIYQTNQIKLMVANPWAKYLWLPVVGPFLEETLFRLWQDYRLKHLLLSGTVLALLIFSKGFHFDKLSGKFIFEVVLTIMVATIILHKK